MQPTTFYIVRHGKSEANKADRISGQMETKLSQEGIEQARNRAKELKSINFDAAFASSLERAHHTAQIIVEERGLSVTTLDILKERFYGEVEGKRYDALEGNLKEQFDSYNAMESFSERFSLKLVPGMESDEEVVGRFMSFLTSTAQKYPGKTVLVVAHGNIMRTLLIHLGFAKLRELQHGTPKNTGYFVLTVEGDTFKVEKTVGIEKKQA